jgi:hypothetical protein
MRFTSLIPIVLITLGGSFGSTLAMAQIARTGWVTYRDGSGTAIEYPRDLFSVSGGRPEGGSGQAFATSDGRAHLSIYVRDNPGRKTPADYLREHFRGSRSALNYDRVAPTFFAVSRNRGETILYRRCNFSYGANAAIHCIDLSYPRSEKRAWDGPVTRISRSLRPLSR